MPLPERVFVVVVETEGGHDPDRMPLLSQAKGERQLTPAFSSLALATTFLAQAQELGYFVKLDYIFPADGRRLGEDFPGHDFVLDVSPQAFFGEGPQA